MTGANHLEYSRHRRPSRPPQTDFYLVEVEKSDDNPLGIVLNHGATLPSHEAWLGTAACALIASMKTYDLVSASGRFKTQIEDGSKRMGIGLDFRLASN